MKTNYSKIVDMFKAGKTVEEISAKMGVSHRTVYRATQELRKGKKASPKPTKPTKVVKKPVEKETEFQWITGNNFVTIVKAGVPYSANGNHHQFENIKAAVDKRDFDKAIDLINLKKAVQTKFGNIEIRGDKLYFHDFLIKNNFATRIISALNKEEDVTKLITFMDALLENESVDMINRLFDFLEHNDVQITDDGHFLAYKRVNSNFTDMYTGKISNKVGETVKVHRSKVDSDMDKTCSNGLHVAAKSYLKHYNNGRGIIIECKVHPRDAVAIPRDYNNTKMRTCKYVVTRVLDEKH